MDRRFTLRGFLLDAHLQVDELEVVKRTGSVFKAPVGMSLLGRVIDATGKPLDGLGEIKPEEMHMILGVPVFLKVFK